MKATEARLLEFLKKSPQFVIPIYQRTYSWTERECQQLWDDILRAGANDEVSAHFVGSIVYIEKGLYQVTSHSPMLVIDGQQRLTTVTLVVAALANALDRLDEEQREPVDGYSPRKLRNYYLLNPEEEGERYYKLLLSQTDKASLIAVVGGSEQPVEPSLRVTQNFAFFESKIAARKGDLTPVCKGLAKLMVVDLALSRDQDNPQLIFESMNSTGRELSQADLIRNFILISISPFCGRVMSRRCRGSGALDVALNAPWGRIDSASTGRAFAPSCRGRWRLPSSFLIRPEACRSRPFSDVRGR
jgi:uncharacterized protein with ParB-like and HNH nuclease domain